MRDKPASNTLLSADSLSLERGGRLLFENLSFSLERGKMVQVEGANGAGKTSLMRVLAGLSRYGFDGNVRRHTPLLYLGHQAGVKGLLSPRENLAWHVSGSAQYENVDIECALAEVGLYGYEDVPSHALSAGQHRRVNLARLFLDESPLWLLDEPFTAIDKAGVASLEARLVAHVEKGGGVLLTSHQTLTVECDIDRLSLAAGGIV